MISGIKEVVSELVAGFVEALTDLSGIKIVNKALSNLELKMMGSYKNWDK
jgi:hypothetical protein